MNNSRRSVILKLAAEAYEMKLNVASGVITRGDDGSWTIGHHKLIEWISEHEGEEVVLIMGSLADDSPVKTRTCHTCGRDYTDLECPYCRASRLRLRGKL